MRRGLALLAALLVLAFTPLSCERHSVRVGSKSFTESVILGELAKTLAQSTDVNALHYQQIGGTQLVFRALLKGEIDIYPEYTGTIREEIFAGRDVHGEGAIREALARQGILMTRPLGFNNSYAIGMKEELAAERGLTKISDLAKAPDLRLRFSSEFMDRGDGWPSLRAHYELSHNDAKGMDHDVAYRLLDEGSADAIDVYTTDAKIRYYGIRQLEDDRRFFPKYDAVFLYRADLEQRAPQVVKMLKRLEGNVSASQIMTMNGYAELHRVPEARVASEFLTEEFGIEEKVEVETVVGRIWRHTKEHIDLVRKSLIAAILVAIPLGILATRMPAVVGQGLLGAVGIIQTIPALALLVMLIAPVSDLGLSTIGSGSATAVIALFLYSLLPIVRNTFTGLRDIPIGLRESAAALGLPATARLWLIELPMASRTILAGIKTAAVINVGFATLGALIGAGGYGQPILTGIRLNDNSLILQGAIPAALMALVVQGLFELAERQLVPKGLRLKAGG